MFYSAPIAVPREARFSGKLRRDLVAQKRPLTELPHIGPFLARTLSGIAIHSSLQRIAFLNPAIPQHESAPFLRIFSD